MSGVPCGFLGGGFHGDVFLISDSKLEIKINAQLC